MHIFLFQSLMILLDVGLWDDEEHCPPTELGSCFHWALPDSNFDPNPRVCTPRLYLVSYLNRNFKDVWAAEPNRALFDLR